jgi:glycosyltransferase involved in cell wall biosynthesis
MRDQLAVPFPNRILAQQTSEITPFLTVAIPHYKHCQYLEVVLASLFEQTFAGFEIVVSDDQSPDDSNVTIPLLLKSSGRAFRYYAQSVNLGYDGNVRFCLSAALGRHVLLLGKDDALTTPDTLHQVANALQQLAYPEVAFTNFQDWSSGWVERRAAGTQLLGAGVPAAVQYYRSFSFVSGLLFDRAAAAQHETDRWDRSIYYQIYLACRILAAGGRLGALDISAVRKDVKVAGQAVPNYASKWARTPWSFQLRHTGVDSALRVAVDAVQPYAPPAQRSMLIRRIIAQALSITYPYWLFEYRRVANWSFSVGIARGMWPGRLLAEYALSFRDRLALWLLYVGATVAGLLIPARWFSALKPRLANFVRRQRQVGRPAERGL